jgi:hypothetical protein
MVCAIPGIYYTVRRRRHVSNSLQSSPEDMVLAAFGNTMSLMCRSSKVIPQVGIPEHTGVRTEYLIATGIVNTRQVGRSLRLDIFLAYSFR